jgi:hypothetical protein
MAQVIPKAFLLATVILLIDYVMHLIGGVG